MSDAAAATLHALSTDRDCIRAYINIIANVNRTLRECLGDAENNLVERGGDYFFLVPTGDVFSIVADIQTYTDLVDMATLDVEKFPETQTWKETREVQLLNYISKLDLTILDLTLSRQLWRGISGILFSVLVYIKKPKKQLYVRMYLPGHAGMASEDYLPVMSEEHARSVAFAEAKCFAFRVVWRKEVMIDNEQFCTETKMHDWVGYFGRAYSLGEIALMSNTGHLLENMRCNNIKECCLARLGNWTPLKDGNKVYDAETGALMLRGGNNAKVLS